MTDRSKLAVGATALVLALGGFAYAQSQQRPPAGHQGPMHGQGMHGQGMHAQGTGPGMMQGQGMHGGGHAAIKGDRSASSLALHAVNAKMHQDMDIAFTGDADVDFVRGMIPHHQGAIDMAKVVMGFGKDPEIRKLAEEIVKAQETEIAMMREWLKKKGK